MQSAETTQKIDTTQSAGIDSVELSAGGGPTVLNGIFRALHNADGSKVTVESQNADYLFMCVRHV